MNRILSKPFHSILIYVEIYKSDKCSQIDTKDINKLLHFSQNYMKYDSLIASFSVGLKSSSCEKWPMAWTTYKRNSKTFVLLQRSDSADRSSGLNRFSLNMQNETNHFILFCQNVTLFTVSYAIRFTIEERSPYWPMCRFAYMMIESFLLFLQMMNGSCWNQVQYKWNGNWITQKFIVSARNSTDSIKKHLLSIDVYLFYSSTLTISCESKKWIPNNSIETSKTLFLYNLQRENCQMKW